MKEGGDRDFLRAPLFLMLAHRAEVANRASSARRSGGPSGFSFQDGRCTVNRCNCGGKYWICWVIDVWKLQRMRSKKQEHCRFEDRFAKFRCEVVSQGKSIVMFHLTGERPQPVVRQTGRLFTCVLLCETTSHLNLESQLVKKERNYLLLSSDCSSLLQLGPSTRLESDSWFPLDWFSSSLVVTCINCTILHMPWFSSRRATATCNLSLYMWK